MKTFYLILGTLMILGTVITESVSSNYGYQNIDSNMDYYNQYVAPFGQNDDRAYKYWDRQRERNNERLDKAKPLSNLIVMN